MGTDKEKKPREASAWHGVKDGSRELLPDSLRL